VKETYTVFHILQLLRRWQLLLLLQVGQLTCAGLAHAYSQCAAVGITSAPLLSALRKACRVKLTSMQPADLTALLTALAALGQQDLLYLDEIAK
jgi:hypothetical protein